MSESTIGAIISGTSLLGNPNQYDGIGANLSNAGTTVSGPMKVRSMHNVRVQVRTGGHASTPVGKWQLQGSEDDESILTADLLNARYGTGNELCQWTTLTLPAGSVHGTNGAALAFSGPSTDITTDGSANVNFIIDVTNPPAHLRLVYVRSSGGGADVVHRAVFSSREI